MPATWVLYGLTGSQLARRGDVIVDYNGASSPLPDALDRAFGISASLTPWAAPILAGHIVFVRVTSVLALRYINFLRR